MKFSSILAVSRVGLFYSYCTVMVNPHWCAFFSNLVRESPKAKNAVSGLSTVSHSQASHIQVFVIAFGTYLIIRKDLRRATFS